MTTKELAAGPRNTVGTLLRDPALAERLSGCAPPGFDCKRLLRETAAALRAAPQLQACSPDSVMVALTRVAALGLSLGPQGEAYLVPRRSKATGTMDATLLVGRNGWISLALRSGKVTSIDAHCVYARDAFRVRLGNGFNVEHEPCLDDDRGAIRGVYAVAQLTDGITRGLWMSARDIAAVRAKADENSAAWREFEGMMSEKVAVKRLARLLAAGNTMLAAAAVAETGAVYDAAPLPEIDEAATTEEEPPPPAGKSDA